MMHFARHGQPGLGACSAPACATLMLGAWLRNPVAQVGLFAAGDVLVAALSTGSLGVLLPPM